MERKHLVKSAGYWFNQAKNPSGVISKEDAILAMEQAYNHLENTLYFLLEKVPGAKEEFDRVNKS